MSLGNRSATSVEDAQEQPQTAWVLDEVHVPPEFAPNRKAELHRSPSSSQINKFKMCPFASRPCARDAARGTRAGNAPFKGYC